MINKHILFFIAIILFFTSCNMYKWERKHYYKKDPTKNWNYVPPVKNTKPTTEFTPK
jgi:hypothetical protein